MIYRVKYNFFFAERQNVGQYEGWSAERSKVPRRTNQGSPGSFAEEEGETWQPRVEYLTFEDDGGALTAY